ncbi:CYTH and CHAD domain-containing protein [Phycicoccus sp. 3266]|uniref:CYTH and CHAD domain-containing protein n=1 Tax=Phycicoccus sp. 3266 TaxID=2817751 RepID=UPI0028619A9F|nr:CYTH and CHAD domain-containing protein [Phycicoccus sp. 3266]MDR6862645.1 CHAD domain-containing protein [Phycicoccus sp. 3266]
MGGSRHREVERKYVVDDRAAVPVDDAPSGSRWTGPQEVRLEAVYFDTPDLDLLRRGVTLRRRTGGTDEGWHVKVPRADGERTELRHPLGRAVRAVPAAVVDEVRAIVRDRTLAPVATVTTHRTEYTLATDIATLATLCDDRVTADSALGEGGRTTWREWELEVAEDALEPATVLASLHPTLRAAGARRSPDFSKVHRALGLSPDLGPSHVVGSSTNRARTERARTKRPRTTRDVVRDRLAHQVAVLHRQDAALRAGDPAAVHRLRIAARRIRAALTTCEPVLAESVDDVRDELRWLGQVLGPARDAQVQRERLGASLDTVPPDLVLGPVRRRLDLELRRQERDALAAARLALRSERYYRLLDHLDALVADVPLSPGGEGPARRVLPGLVRRDARRLRRAVRAVDGAAAGERDAALHEARKKAKRLRYAAELARPVGSARARKLARRAKRVQEELGRHQDSVMAREVLRRLGAQAFLEGENGFTFGLLHGLERLAAADSQARFRRAWTAVPSPRDAESWVARGR